MLLQICLKIEMSKYFRKLAYQAALHEIISIFGKECDNLFIESSFHKAIYVVSHLYVYVVSHFFVGLHPSLHTSQFLI